MTKDVITLDLALKYIEELENENWEMKEQLKRINTPMVKNFIKSVENEIKHQNIRWNDNQKKTADWFWLVGYLAGKALSAKTKEKKLHHIITTCAALGNWFAYEKKESE